MSADKALDIDRRFIVNSFGRLACSGLVMRNETGVYTISHDGLRQLASGKPIKSGRQGPRTGVRRIKSDGLRQRMWNAMRQFSAGGQRHAFSLPDLLTIALKASEETPSTYNNAGQYVLQLKKNGISVNLNAPSKGHSPRLKRFCAL
ncbi:MAG: hypothetical protein U5K75_02495 [Ahrensia sp.]|nr:hypothetical protein [Ahrensia sp.]